jgi:hypothetical protein
MTTEQTRPDRDPYHDQQHAAALARAAALRALHSYRAARDRAEWRGTVDATLLTEPPSFADLDAAYGELVEEYLDRSIKSPRTARSAVDLLAAILSEQQLSEILDEGGPVSIEKDRGDALRLLASLSGWINDMDIAEEWGTGITPHWPQPSLDPADKAELRRRAVAIVAEFGAIPEANDDGIVEAERRLNGLRAAYCELAKAFTWDIDTEQEIVEPTLTAAENALIEFIEDTPAESLKAAAVKLRGAIDEPVPEADCLRQVLAVVEAASAEPATAAAASNDAAGDPLPALVQQYFDLVAEYDKGEEGAPRDRLYDAGEALVQAIVDMVPATPAGMLAQLRLMRNLLHIEEHGGFVDRREVRVIDAIAAGIERMGSGSAA